MKKKILLGLASIGITMSLLGNSAYASEKTLSMDEVDKILIDFGYEKENLAYFNDDRKIKIAEAIQEDPESVSMSTSYTHVDNVGIISYYTNTSDETLSKNGTSKEQIKKIREKLNKLNSASDSEIMEKYKLSKGEAKLIRDALKKKPNYKAPKEFGEKEVTTSGEISTSTLSFNMTVDNNSTSTAPSYDVDLHHNWYKPFFFDIVDDNVAAAWGGNLNTKNIGGITYYNWGNWYTGGFSGAWGSLWTNAVENPNTGLVWSFQQNQSGDDAQAKSGNYWFTAYQTKKQGYDSKIVAQYAHKVMTVTDVTVSKTPAINIGIGKDYSPQERYTIRY